MKKLKRECVKIVKQGDIKMKLKFNINEIKINNKCKHLAYNEKCLVCMFEFSFHYRPEIIKKGLDEQIKEIKKGGGFL